MTTDFEGLREREKEILEILGQKHSMYVSEIIENTRQPRPTVYTQLRSLKELDLVEREESGQRVFYSLTETWENYEANKEDLRNISRGWLKVVNRQITVFEHGFISPEEFGNRMWGDLIPLLPQSLLGEAYTRVVNISDKEFHEIPDEGLNRKQQELLIFAYSLCRETELEGLSKLSAVDEIDEFEIETYFSRPMSRLREYYDNGLGESPGSSPDIK